MARRVEFQVEVDTSRMRQDLEQAKRSVATLTTETDKLQKEFDQTGRSNKRLGDQLKSNNSTLRTQRNRVQNLTTAVKTSERAVRGATDAQRVHGASVAVVDGQVRSLTTAFLALATAGFTSDSVFTTLALNLERFGERITSIASKLKAGSVKSIGVAGTVAASAILIPLILGLGAAVRGLTATQEGLEAIDRILVPIQTRWASFIGLVQDDIFATIEFFRRIPRIFEGIFTLIQSAVQNFVISITTVFQKQWINTLERQNRLFGLFTDQLVTAKNRLAELESGLVDLNEEWQNFADLFNFEDFYNDRAAGEASDRIKEINQELRELRGGRFDEDGNQIQQGIRQRVAILDREIAAQRLILENRNLDSDARRQAATESIRLGEARAALLRQELSLEEEKLELQYALNATSQEELEQLDQLRAQIEGLDTAYLSFVRRIQSAALSIPREEIANALQESFEVAVPDISSELDETLKARLNANAQEIQGEREKANLIREINQELQDYRLALIDQSIERAEEAFGVESGIARALTAIKAIELATQAIAELKNNEFLAKLALQRSLLAGEEATANAAKIGFPQNLLAIAATAAQFIGIISAVANAGRALRNVVKPPTFERGGILPIGGKRHSAGGTKFYGEDGTVFEAEAGEAIVLNRGATSALMPLFNQANIEHGGSSLYHRSSYLQTGGTVQRQPIFDIDRLADRIVSGVAEANRNIVNVVSVEDINRTSDRVNVIQNNARF